MNDAIIYYRARPSEPEASETAMRLQRQAVCAAVEAGQLQVVGEFIEQEDEASDQVLRLKREALWRAVETDKPFAEGNTRDETRRAYYAAVEAARAHGAACLVVVSHAAIGSGEVFAEPWVEQGSGLLHVMLAAALVPTLPDIPVPAGAPGPLCLYADFRPGQLETLVYLCNAGPEALSVVTVDLDSITMFEFYREEPEQRWVDASTFPKQQWDVLPAGRAVLIDTLSHAMWDFVDRYRLAWSDGVGRRWTVAADSLAFNAERLAQDPTRVWEELAPARSADRCEEAV
ncbi:hypothetical protein Rumeso_03671 [Rubellimicrobium mesophilum DSM 19309]|uniref:Uncharacterized protein n=1 Tax=Rubellimicrobium mesophilum DSM 19309 TaxID=442562 RepID=A0A017HKM8_9RHOB|nr:hypothetical protein [Rubellimicrobium mesophilum]EYD74718.1 hypothetical protein Rumeso_03671 [Rubellimicrobium mesophilum DSM 19309]